MEHAVHRGGAPVGTIHITEENGFVDFTVRCTPGTTEVLRCYGLRPPAPPLLIGIPEPEKDGTMSFHRRLSRQSIASKLPERYVLLDASQDAAAEQGTPASPQLPSTEKGEPPAETLPAEEMTPETGDALLDVLLHTGEVQSVRIDGKLCLQCPFDPQSPFPLIPAAAACVVEPAADNWKAVLYLE